jgi:hypothetical protein
MKGQNINTEGIPVESVAVSREALKDLARVKDEFSTIVESLELMDDPAFIRSYRKAKSQIRKREFADEL